MRADDEIIDAGFPAGWRVEHRPAENVSILCRQSDFAVGGLRAICLRPSAVSLKNWLPVAIMIAHGFDIFNAKTPEEDPHA